MERDTGEADDHLLCPRVEFGWSWRRSKLVWGRDGSQPINACKSASRNLHPAVNSPPHFNYLTTCFASSLHRLTDSPDLHDELPDQSVG